MKFKTFIFFILASLVFCFRTVPSYAQVNLYSIPEQDRVPLIFIPTKLIPLGSSIEIPAAVDKRSKVTDMFTVGVDDDKIVKSYEQAVSPHVLFYAISPTLYKVRIDNPEHKDIVLMLNQTFHNAWRISINESPLPCQSMKKNEEFNTDICVSHPYESAAKNHFISSFFEEEIPSRHIRINDFANGWYINGENFQENTTWVTIQFSIQTYVYCAIFISLVTALMAFLTIIWYHVRHSSSIRYDKK